MEVNDEILNDIANALSKSTKGNYGQYEQAKEVLSIIRGKSSDLGLRGRAQTVQVALSTLLSNLKLSTQGLQMSLSAERMNKNFDEIMDSAVSTSKEMQKLFEDFELERKLVPALQETPAEALLFSKFYRAKEILQSSVIEPEHHETELLVLVSVGLIEGEDDLYRLSERGNKYMQARRSQFDKVSRKIIRWVKYGGASSGKLVFSSALSAAMGVAMTAYFL